MAEFIESLDAIELVELPHLNELEDVEIPWGDTPMPEEEEPRNAVADNLNSENNDLVHVERTSGLRPYENAQSAELKHQCTNNYGAAKRIKSQACHIIESMFIGKVKLTPEKQIVIGEPDTMDELLYYNLSRVRGTNVDIINTESLTHLAIWSDFNPYTSEILKREFFDECFHAIIALMRRISSECDRIMMFSKRIKILDPLLGRMPEDIHETGPEIGRLPRDIFEFVVQSEPDPDDWNFHNIFPIVTQIKEKGIVATMRPKLYRFGHILSHAQLLLNAYLCNEFAHVYKKSEMDKYIDIGTLSKQIELTKVPPEVQMFLSVIGSSVKLSEKGIRTSGADTRKRVTDHLRSNFGQQAMDLTGKSFVTSGVKEFRELVDEQRKLGQIPPQIYDLVMDELELLCSSKESRNDELKVRKIIMEVSEEYMVYDAPRMCYVQSIASNMLCTHGLLHSALRILKGFIFEVSQASVYVPEYDKFNIIETIQNEGIDVLRSSDSWDRTPDECYFEDGILKIREFSLRNDVVGISRIHQDFKEELETALKGSIELDFQSIVCDNAEADELLKDTEHHAHLKKVRYGHYLLQTFPELQNDVVIEGVSYASRVRQQRKKKKPFVSRKNFEDFLKTVKEDQLGTHALRNFTSALYCIKTIGETTSMEATERLGRVVVEEMGAPQKTRQPTDIKSQINVIDKWCKENITNKIQVKTVKESIIQVPIPVEILKTDDSFNFSLDKIQIFKLIHKVEGEFSLRGRFKESGTKKQFNCIYSIAALKCRMGYYVDRKFNLRYICRDRKIPMMLDRYLYESTKIKFDEELLPLVKLVTSEDYELSDDPEDLSWPDLSRSNKLMNIALKELKPYLDNTPQETAEMLLAKRMRKELKEVDIISQLSIDEVAATLKFLMSKSKLDLTHICFSEDSLKALSKKLFNIRSFDFTEYIMNCIDSLRKSQFFNAACFANLVGRWYFKATESRASSDFCLTTTIDGSVSMVISNPKVTDVGFSYKAILLSPHYRFRTHAYNMSTEHDYVSSSFQIGSRDAILYESLPYRILLRFMHDSSLKGDEQTLVETPIDITSYSSLAWNVMFSLRNKRHEQPWLQDKRYSILSDISTEVEGAKLAKKYLPTKVTSVSAYYVQELLKCKNYNLVNYEMNILNLFHKNPTLDLRDPIHGHLKNFSEVVNSCYDIHWTHNILLTLPRISMNAVAEEAVKQEVPCWDYRIQEPAFATGGPSPITPLESENRSLPGWDAQVVRDCMAVTMGLMGARPLRVMNDSLSDSILRLSNTTSVVTERPGEFKPLKVEEDLEKCHVASDVHKIKSHHQTIWREPNSTKKEREEAVDWYLKESGSEGFRKYMDAGFKATECVIGELKNYDTRGIKNFIEYTKVICDDELVDLTERFEVIMSCRGNVEPVTVGQLDTMPTLAAEFKAVELLNAKEVSKIATKLKKIVPPVPGLTAKKISMVRVKKELSDKGIDPKFLSDDGELSPEVLREFSDKEMQSMFLIECMVMHSNPIKNVNTQQELSKCLLLSKLEYSGAERAKTILEFLRLIYASACKPIHVSLKRLKTRRFKCPQSTVTKVIFALGSTVLSSTMKTSIMDAANEASLSHDPVFLRLAPKQQLGANRAIYIQTLQDKYITRVIDKISETFNSEFPNETLHDKNAKMKLIKRFLGYLEHEDWIGGCYDNSKWGPCLYAMMCVIMICMAMVIKGMPMEFILFFLKYAMRSLIKEIEIPGIVMDRYLTKGPQNNPNFYDFHPELSRAMEKSLANNDIFFKQGNGFMPGLLHHSSSTVACVCNKAICHVIMLKFNDASLKASQEDKGEHLSGNVYKSKVKLPGLRKDELERISKSRISNKEYFQMVKDCESLEDYNIYKRLYPEQPRFGEDRLIDVEAVYYKADGKCYPIFLKMESDEGSDDEFLPTCYTAITPEKICVTKDCRTFDYTVRNTKCQITKRCGYIISPKALSIPNAGEFNSAFCNAVSQADSYEFMGGFCPTRMKFMSGVMEMKPTIGPIEYFNQAISFSQEAMSNGVPQAHIVAMIFCLYQRIGKFMKHNSITDWLAPPQLGGIPSCSLSLLFNPWDKSKFSFECEVSQRCLQQAYDWKLYLEICETGRTKLLTEKSKNVPVDMNLKYSYTVSKHIRSMKSKISDMRTSAGTNEELSSIRPLIRDEEPGTHEAEVFKLDTILSSPSISRGSPDVVGVYNLLSTSFRDTRIIIPKECKLFNHIELNEVPITPYGDKKVKLTQIRKAIEASLSDGEPITFDVTAKTADIKMIYDLRFNDATLIRKKSPTMQIYHLNTGFSSHSSMKNPSCAILWSEFSQLAQKYYPTSLLSDVTPEDVQILSNLYKENLLKLRRLRLDYETHKTEESRMRLTDYLSEFLSTIDFKRGRVSKLCVYMPRDMIISTENVLKNSGFLTLTMSMGISPIIGVRPDVMTFDTKLSETILYLLKTVPVDDRKEFMKKLKLIPEVSELIKNLSLVNQSPKILLTRYLMNDNPNHCMSKLESLYRPRAGMITCRHEKFNDINVYEGYLRPHFFSLIDVRGRSFAYTNCKDLHILSKLINIAMSQSASAMTVRENRDLIFNLESIGSLHVEAGSQGLYNVREEEDGNIGTSTFPILTDNFYTIVDESVDYTLKVVEESKGFSLVEHVYHGESLTSKALTSVNKSLLYIPTKIRTDVNWNFVLSLFTFIAGGFQAESPQNDDFEELKSKAYAKLSLMLTFDDVGQVVLDCIQEFGRNPVISALKMIDFSNPIYHQKVVVPTEPTAGRLVTGTDVEYPAFQYCTGYDMVCTEKGYLGRLLAEPVAFEVRNKHVIIDRSVFKHNYSVFNTLVSLFATKKTVKSRRVRILKEDLIAYCCVHFSEFRTRQEREVLGMILSSLSPLPCPIHIMESQNVSVIRRFFDHEYLENLDSDEDFESEEASTETLSDDFLERELDEDNQVDDSLLKTKIVEEEQEDPIMEAEESGISTDPFKVETDVGDSPNSFAALLDLTSMGIYPEYDRDEELYD